MSERRRRTERYDAEYDEACVYAETEDDPAPAMEMEAPAASEQSSPLPHGVVATNTGVRLACTMSAMIGLFALFLCWAEKESRVIRRFAVQSASLTVAHLAVVLIAATVSLAIGWVPYFGLMVTLMCWLVCIAAFLLLTFVRIRLMERAWHGLRFDMPGPIEKLLSRLY